MLTVSCRDVGMDCDYVCKGETEEEIMENAKQHFIRANSVYVVVLVQVYRGNS